jgi:hypothetical protein
MSSRFGQAGAAFLVIILVIIAVIVALPYFGTLSFGGGYSGPLVQGVIVSSAGVPSSITPSSSFGVTFSVSNNFRGSNANDIELCLDNLGILTNQTPSCVPLGLMFPGETVPETFILRSPPNGFYGNVPYTQDIGYYLKYAYESGSSQYIEFASQQSINSGSFATPSFQSASATAGPVAINSTVAQQPLLYGTTAQLLISINNIGTGVVLGSVGFNITMNSSLIQIPSPSSFSLKEHTLSNGIVSYTGSAQISGGTFTITLPVALSSGEASLLSSSSVPYLSFPVHLSTNYTYEEDAFYPVTLGIQNYNYYG